MTSVKNVRELKSPSITPLSSTPPFLPPHRIVSPYKISQLCRQSHFSADLHLMRCHLRMCPKTCVNIIHSPWCLPFVARPPKLPSHQWGHQNSNCPFLSPSLLLLFPSPSPYPSSLPPLPSPSTSRQANPQKCFSSYFVRNFYFQFIILCLTCVM